MRPTNLACLLFMLGSAPPILADGGFATRDLNPLLQPVFLPGLTRFGDTDGWRIDYSLYITNTLQQEGKGDETLLIDVENYRYELGLRYRRGQWLARLDIPWVHNSTGQLDSAIENWHDFFGLPQGKRDEFPRDQIKLNYQRDGVNLLDLDSSAGGIGDIALAIGYQPEAGWTWFAGAELATGSKDDLSGNGATDLALWATRQFRLDQDTGGFALLGLAFPGDSNYLEGLVVERIWAAQLGFDYRFNPSVIATLQLDLHTRSIEHSDLTAFGESLQVQLGLGFPRLFAEHRLDLFFSEDILVGSAPDISFGLRLSRAY